MPDPEFKTEAQRDEIEANKVKAAQLDELERMEHLKCTSLAEEHLRK